MWMEPLYVNKVLFTTRYGSMPKAKTTKKSVVPMPQNLNEAAEFVRGIGKAERDIEQANNEMNALLEAVKQPFIEQVGQHQHHLATLVEGLYAYAQGNRFQLTDGDKKKTVTLPTGTFSWRMTPKSVLIKGKNSVLAKLKELKLDRFIRIKEEVDKEAILKDEGMVASVDGITIEQCEEFVVKPAETNAEVSTTAGKRALKLALPSGSRNKPPKKKLA